jgi:quercetin dioxygenase-like cupin family protein
LVIGELIIGHSLFFGVEDEMAIPHAKPGEVIDVRPYGASLSAATTTTLVKADKLEVVRLVLAAGKEISQHQARGEITVHCLEGKVAFTAQGQTHELTAGQMLYLDAQAPHSLRCLEGASLLLTLVSP